jgi:succinyl-CoA synthetase beta subunit
MLRKEISKILEASKERGWVLEPDAKRLFALAGMNVPRFKCTTKISEAEAFARQIGHPLVAKAVSTMLVHKSDAGAVIVNIDSVKKLREAYSRFSNFDGFLGMLVEEMLSGIELIVGAKIDYQFGPVILLGIGGTGVEIYGDTTLRMAPLTQSDVTSMLANLKAHQLLEGYRGSDAINLKELAHMMITFSELVMELQSHIESIDMNPVICNPDRCVIADARVVLNTNT